MTYNAVAFLEGLFMVGMARATAAETIPTHQWSGVGVEDLPGDWRVWFEERAAIKEYCGNMPRERAEAQALAEAIELMKRERL